MHILQIDFELLRILNYWSLNDRGFTVCEFVSTTWIKVSG